MVLEKTLESPLDCKVIQPVHCKGDQPWMFIGRTDVEAETLILWPPHVKSWLVWKDPDSRKDWGQEEKGMTEDEMAGWHHRLNRCETDWIPRVCDGQGGLMWFMGSKRVGHDWAIELNWSYMGIPNSNVLKIQFWAFLEAQWQRIHLTMWLEDKCWIPGPARSHKQQSN